MKKRFHWAFVVIATALIQTTWLDALRLQGVVPDLILLLVVYFAITDGEERAMLTGVLGGMYQDVAANAVLGHYVLCNVVVGYAAGKISRRLLSDHPAIKTALVLGAALVHGILYTAILYVQKPDIRAIRTVGVSVIPGAFYTALATPVVFFVFSRMFEGRKAVQGEAV